MPASVGGAGSSPSPGWLFRAALASCEATLIAMRAAVQGIQLSRLEVAVDSESDDRGILGLDEGVPAGPLRIHVRVRLASPDATEGELRNIADWGAGTVRSPTLRVARSRLRWTSKQGRVKAGRVLHSAGRHGQALARSEFRSGPE